MSESGSDSESLHASYTDSDDDPNSSDNEQCESDFFPAYDPDIEPEATEEEYAQYEQARAREEEEEEMLNKRFSREIGVDEW